MPTNYEMVISNLDRPKLQDSNTSGATSGEEVSYTATLLDISYASLSAKVTAGAVQFSTSNEGITNWYNVTASETSGTAFPSSPGAGAFTAITGYNLARTTATTDFTNPNKSIKIVPYSSGTQSVIVTPQILTAGDQATNAINEYALKVEDLDISSVDKYVLPITEVHNCVGDQDEVIFGTWSGILAPCP